MGQSRREEQEETEQTDRERQSEVEHVATSCQLSTCQEHFVEAFFEIMLGLMSVLPRR